jgi:hypothetical protein
MHWFSYLLVLLCPLMMIFCMRGHNHQHEPHLSNNMEKKLKLLEEENNKLKYEIETLAKIVKKGS